MKNRITVVIILLIVAFSAGFVPQYIKVMSLEQRERGLAHRISTGRRVGCLRANSRASRIAHLRTV